jgi:hypothetical protein
MKFEDMRKQIIKAVNDALESGIKQYNDLIDEDPESTYEYCLMRRAGCMAIGKGAISVIKTIDISDTQKARLKSDVNKLVTEHRSRYHG